MSLSGSPSSPRCAGQRVIAAASSLARRGTTESWLRAVPVRARAPACQAPQARRRRSLLFLLAVLLLAPAALDAAIGDASILAPAPQAGGVTLFANGTAAPILIDSGDWPGARRVASDLAADIERVTGVRPDLGTTATAGVREAILIGTLGKSALIDRLVAAGTLDVSAIAGRWEAFTIAVVERPLAGLDRALVIAGSDKRGTIYGTYEVSQQIGVSPWYWWADVPVARRDALHVAATARVVESGPVVRYRGIFINDEAPALSRWAEEKFGGFNHTMYAHMFELILRLRGNYLWPAMWLPRAFIDDDPENARLADEYGIVIGTSHHEPMMRAHAEWSRHGSGPWDYAKNDAVLREFWRTGVERVANVEKLVTLGMRGDGDEAMSEQTNVALLGRIVRDQRTILAEVQQQPIEQVPQVWALYKEVQGYYERGMRVSDDVTLLWCDDNWGNIRRLPTAQERARPGGAGVYYHFDYVGGPRNYKWLNVTPLPKIWEQMHLAWQYDANRIWIVNVGDLKPMEYPIEFFLTYSWDPSRWPYERLDEFSNGWAAREFGARHAVEIARLVNRYAKLNRQRTPEMLDAGTYSVVHYREAERILAQWHELVRTAQQIEAALDPGHRDAFYQLVLYPVRASAVVREMHVAAGTNRLFAEQGRHVAANEAAARVQALFAEDAALVQRYHALAGGKWNHQMAQTKLGYTFWQSPPIDVAPAVSTTRAVSGAEPAIAIEGDAHARPRWGSAPPAVPPLDRIRKGERGLVIFNRGDTPFAFTATAEPAWLRVSPSAATVRDEVRVELGVDWANVPNGGHEGHVTLTTDTGASFRVRVPLADVEPAAGAPAGTFIEVDGHVAIDAPHFARAIGEADLQWKTLADFGRTTGGVTLFPVNAADRPQPGGQSPRLEYDVQFAAAGTATLEFHFAPSLDFQPGDGLRFAWSVGDAEPQVLRVGTWSTDQTWERAVGDSVRTVRAEVALAAGHQVLRFWYVTPGVVLERILIDTGGLKPSHLGPPESPRLPGLRASEPAFPAPQQGIRRVH